jgi:aryl-alcohol dehydrogenase-like predicted oxidoreductase
MKLLQLSQQQKLPRPVSIQNPYSLLNHTFEIGLAEIAHQENCGLLAYSPLGYGVLSGKYLGGAQPAGARLTLFHRFNRYSNPQSDHATRAYVELAWVAAQPFVTSTIIGATDLQQLETNLQSLDLPLSAAIMEGIETIHQQQPNPCP